MAGVSRREGQVVESGCRRDDFDDEDPPPAPQWGHCVTSLPVSRLADAARLAPEPAGAIARLPRRSGVNLCTGWRWAGVAIPYARAEAPAPGAAIERATPAGAREGR